VETPVGKLLLSRPTIFMGNSSGKRLLSRPRSNAVENPVGKLLLSRPRRISLGNPSEKRLLSSVIRNWGIRLKFNLRKSVVRTRNLKWLESVQRWAFVVEVLY
jgi:hypothetical protein